MYEPFEGEPQVRNYNRLNPEQLRRYFRTAQEFGWDVGVHTCGDHAMDMVVEAFADVIEACPNPDARHNVIHAFFPVTRPWTSRSSTTSVPSSNRPSSTTRAT
jgi:predicted amidohydrolase YtcJ